MIQGENAQQAVEGLMTVGALPEHLQAKVVSSTAKDECRSSRARDAPPPRDFCSGCSRHPVVCLCEALPQEKLKTHTKILILQHPNEFRRKTLSTVPLLRMVLNSVQVEVGYQFSVRDLPLVEQMLFHGCRPLLLFPGEDAIPLEQPPPLALPQSMLLAGTAEESLTTAGVKASYLLIIFDGTWAEAKRMALQSPELVEQCQRVTFTTTRACLYDAIRKEPDAHCYSTLEACARALEVLEGAFEVARYLEDVLRHMIETIKVQTESRRHDIDDCDDPRPVGNRGRRTRHRQRTRETLRFRPEPRVIDRESGAILRPLTVEDAESVNANTYKPSASRLSTIKSRLSIGFACFGIEREGKLVAHVLRCEDGSLGMVHVDAVYLDKGYGEELLAEACSVLDRSGHAKKALIKEGNSVMESLFQNAGWTLADDEVVRHEGYLRRRWIHCKPSPR
jgi:DTW domain-containing protein